MSCRSVGRDCRHQLPVDVDWLAAALGFSRVVANSIDATGDRDFVASFLHAAALAWCTSAGWPRI